MYIGIKDKYWTHDQPGFEPAKAKQITSKSKLADYTWVEPKLDGARALVHCTSDGVVITSRRVNKDGVYRQWQDNLPHLKTNSSLVKLCNSEYTILDGELMMDSLSSTMSVVGANPDTAIAYQEEHGLADLVLFDCIMYKGVDVTNLQLHERRKNIDNIKNTAYLYNVDYQVAPYGGAIQVAEAYVKEGLEGAMLKNPNSMYFQSGAWLKYKKAITIDGEVTGFVPGKGKYNGEVGALRVSVIDVETSELREICSVAPGTDFERSMWNTYFYGTTYYSDPRIVELECMEWSVHKRLRHPRLKRKRPDLSSANTVDFSGDTPNIV